MELVRRIKNQIGEGKYFECIQTLKEYYKKDRINPVIAEFSFGVLRVIRPYHQAKNRYQLGKNHYFIVKKEIIECIELHRQINIKPSPKIELLLQKVTNYSVPNKLNQYTDLLYLPNNIIGSNLKEKEFLLSIKGEILHRSTQPYVTWFDKFIVFSKEDKFGLLNQTGEIVIEAKYDKILSANSEMMIVISNNKSSLLNSKTRAIGSTEWDEIRPAGNSFFFIRQAEKWSILSPSRIELSQFIFDDVDMFFDQKVVKKDGVWYVIDDLGVLVKKSLSQHPALRFFPPLNIGSYEKNGIWYLINKNGKTVCEDYYLQNISKYE